MALGYTTATHPVSSLSLRSSPCYKLIAPPIPYHKLRSTEPIIRFYLFTILFIPSSSLGLRFGSTYLGIRAPLPLPLPWQVELKSEGNGNLMIIRLYF